MNVRHVLCLCLVAAFGGANLSCGEPVVIGEDTGAPALDAGASDVATVDRVQVDASRAADTIQQDSGAVQDAAARDLTGVDSTQIDDAGAADVWRPDAAALDSRASDGAIGDAGVLDSGQPDTSMPDTSVPDANQPDAWAPPPSRLICRQGAGLDWQLRSTPCMVSPSCDDIAGASGVWDPVRCSAEEVGCEPALVRCGDSLCQQGEDEVSCARDCQVGPAPYNYSVDRPDIYGAVTGTSINVSGACDSASYPNELPWATSDPAQKPAFKQFHHEGDAACDVSCMYKARHFLLQQGYVDHGVLVIANTGARSVGKHFWPADYNTPMLEFFAGF